MTAKLFTPGKIVAIDLDDGRLAKAKEFGADVTINNGREDAVKRVLELTGGFGADVAVEAFGIPSTGKANTSGNSPATTVDNARLQLGDSVSVYVQGYVTGSLPSTVIDLTTPGEPRLLREGAVSAHAICEVIGDEVSLVS